MLDLALYHSCVERRSVHVGKAKVTAVEAVGPVRVVKP